MVLKTLLFRTHKKVCCDQKIYWREEVIVFDGAAIIIVVQ